MIYLIAIISLVALGLLALLFRKNGDDAQVVQAEGCATCNGDNDKCEQDCMMEAATQPVVYYDDEELDRFAGRQSEDYSDDEAEQFREVLMTMLPSDVKGWNRSLILRGINVPNQLKDELLLLLSD